MDIQKPNDIFAAYLQKPDINIFDLSKSNISSTNTQLLSQDDYKKSPTIQKMFSDTNGNFDTSKFNEAYIKAADLYKNLDSVHSLSKAIEYDPTDFTAPVGSKKIDVRPTITGDFNPFKNLYSRTGINSIDQSDLSIRELAQQGNIYDWDKKEWLNKSANDLNIFDKFLGKTLVYAQYDEDTKDPLTGVEHKKGDWKLDNSGNLFVETLGNRELYGKQIVNPMDIITTDGSAINKIDFFDSDG